MGAKVQIENYMPGHYSMRDLSRESNGASWPPCYGDNNLANGQFYYGFLPRPFGDLQPEYDKDVVKQTMLEHEAIFKNQVYELHRLYQVQRDLMDEVRRKEQFSRQLPYEASSSSSPVPSQMRSEDVQRWNGSSLPLANSSCSRPSILGPDTTIQSSPHSTKGKNIQAGPSPIKNCHSPRNSEVSESRPTKSRRRMLDLQLPANEYIDDTDEVEQFGDAKVSDNIIFSPDKNGKLGSNFGKSKVLADLNEPIYVEETTGVSSVDFLGHAGSQRNVQCGDLSKRLLNSSKDVPQNSWHGSLNGTLSNLPSDNRPNNRDWFSYALESEQRKGGFRSINQGIHEQKPIIPSQLVQVPLDQGCQPPAFLKGEHMKGDPWKAKYGGMVEKSDRSYHPSSSNISDQIRSSHLPNHQPSFFHHSDLGKSLDQCASSWGKPSNFLDQKSIQVQATPFLSSSQRNDSFGKNWNLNSIPGANGPFGAEPSLRNGFYQGSSASFREATPACFTPAGFDYTNCNYNNDKRKPMRDVNLNEAVPNGLSSDHNDHNSEDPLAVLPWLRGKGTCQNEAGNSRKGSNALASTQFRGLPFASSSCDGEHKAKNKPESNGCRKILGVPIFGSPSIVKKEDSVIASPSAVDHHRSGKEEVENGRRRVVFDMNLPCEPEPTDSEPPVEEVVIVEKEIQTKSATFINHFDLNSCITEEEETPCGTSLLDNTAIIKGGTGIDLEAPVVIESDEEPLVKEPEKHPEGEDDHSETELARSAAEVIIAISSSSSSPSVVNPNPLKEGEADLEDALRWFVGIACSSGNDLEIPDDEGERNRENGGSLRVLDDFESMTLNLKECTFEEYFPKPSFPEIPNLEETSGRCLLATRTRKGQARRGRQRRDFQRDILPGLTSLSRHEVTEDLQTFGGLMRATGHPWHSGPNRRNATRNGSGRGRRRSVVAAHAPVNTESPPPSTKEQIGSAEVGLEDRSLTGWGKTTRRPRRQRYPAGNPPLPVPLS